MFAACELARECWNDEFNKKEQAEQIEKLKQEKQRKLTEIIYLTDPNYPPELINLNSPIDKARNDEGLVWSENRLIELGFKINLEGNVKSYTDERKEFVIYADPRYEKGISFRAFKKSLSKHLRLIPLHRQYKILDTWKHDLKTKYENWIAKEIYTL